jgi:hypothetical protein
MTTTRRLILALAIVAPAAGRASAQSLLSNRSIHDELKVTPEQAAKLDALDRNLVAESRERARKLQELPPDERRKAMQENLKASQVNFRQTWEERHRKLAEFLSPEQIKRFDQISVQRAGFAAFTMLPHVRDRMKFTEDQVATLLEVQEELAQMAAPRAALQQKILQDPEGMRKKSDEATKAATAKIVAVMTDEQKKTWADLTGPPFQIKYERPPAP